jgi:hypothetical protein
MNYEPTEKELEAVRKWQTAYKPPLTTDELRELETKNFLQRQEQRRLYDEEQAHARLVLDPITNEKVSPEEMARRSNARALAEFQERLAQPIVMTDDQMRDELARKADIQRRFDAARNESLKRQGLTDVAIGKF